MLEEQYAAVDEAWTAACSVAFEPSSLALAASGPMATSAPIHQLDWIRLHRIVDVCETRLAVDRRSRRMARRVASHAVATSTAILAICACGSPEPRARTPEPWHQPNDESTNNTDAHIARAAAAIDALDTSCNLGAADACRMLGHRYQFGIEVVADPTRAVESFHRGCERRDTESCMLAGKLGLPSNARHYYERACDFGDHRGCDAIRDREEAKTKSRKKSEPRPSHKIDHDIDLPEPDWDR